jgi:hypothetical protein
MYSYKFSNEISQVLHLNKNNPVSNVHKKRVFHWDLINYLNIYRMKNIVHSIVKK